MEAGAIAKQLGQLVALAEGQGLISIPPILAHNCMQFQFQG